MDETSVDNILKKDLNLEMIEKIIIIIIAFCV
jgi:hypothetical protein